ncbi:hypothetical protein KUTeg_006452 [Tegillarca granosa]|uniref:Uncharacterized protein n=1 Tax=Tegillarca granosa TaxID=220873 RepID=A0ABQ9FL36_TEGGR|nr:hypothetical protein KUTeg_006452 [Tegillarca granosa]
MFLNEFEYCENFHVASSFAFNFSFEDISNGKVSTGQTGIETKKDNDENYIMNWKLYWSSISTCRCFYVKGYREFPYENGTGNLIIRKDAGFFWNKLSRL